MERKSNFLVSNRASASGPDSGEGPTNPQSSIRGEEGAAMLEYKRSQHANLENVSEDALSQGRVPYYSERILDGQTGPLQVLLGIIDSSISSQILPISNGWRPIPMAGSPIRLYQLHAGHGMDHGASADEDQCHGNPDLNMGGQYPSSPGCQIMAMVAVLGALSYDTNCCVFAQN